MIKAMPIPILDCPNELQTEVQKRLAEPGSEICSVTVTESTPYKDKSVISRQYRVIMNRMNLVSVLHCYDDGVLKDKVSSKGHSVAAIIQRLNEEADTARRYLDLCELEVLEPRFSDDFILKLLYEIINKRTGQRVKLPEGVFDMTTAIHGIYE